MRHRSDPDTQPIPIAGRLQPALTERKCLLRKSLMLARDGMRKAN